MTWNTDDRSLYWQQRRLDAQQERAAEAMAKKLLDDIEESKSSKARRNSIPAYTRFLWAIQDIPRYYYIKLLIRFRKK